MYVSSEVRHREIPESSPDQSLYASAANGASFMAILSEVGRAPDKNVEEKPAADVEAPSETAAVADGAAKGETVTEESTAKTPATETETEDAVNSESGDGGSAVVPPGETGPPEVSVQPPPATSGPTPPMAPATPGVEARSPAPEAALTAVALTVTGASLVSLEVLSGDNVVVAGPPADAAPLASETISGTPAVAAMEAGASTATGLETAPATEAAPAPPQAVFPKTLNAIIAEGALRPPPDSPGTAEDAAPGPEGMEVLEAAIEPGTADTATDVPKPPALPQAAALEAGGVRPQAAPVLPRLPMANLPGELAQQIHRMQQEGANTMRLRLVPENLGDIQIEIQGTGDRLQVRLVSANPAVRDALESQMDDLKSALQKQGLALDNATVDGGSAGRNAPREPERRATPTPYRAAPELTETPGTTIRRTAPLALGSSALNILA